MCGVRSKSRKKKKKKPPPKIDYLSRPRCFTLIFFERQNSFRIVSRRKPETRFRIHRARRAILLHGPALTKFADVSSTRRVSCVFVCVCAHARARVCVHGGEGVERNVIRTKLSFTVCLTSRCRRREGAEGILYIYMCFSDPYWISSGLSREFPKKFFPAFAVRAKSRLPNR